MKLIALLLSLLFPMYAVENAGSGGGEGEGDDGSSGSEGDGGEGDGGEGADDLHGDIARALEPKDGEGEGEGEGAEGEGGEGEGAEGDRSQVLEAPTHWPQADRELFAKLPKDGQQFLLRRHTDLERDYTRKTSEIAPARKLKESIDEVFKPFKRQMELNGTDEVAAIKQLVASHQYLLDKPEEAILWLAQNYGVDIPKLVESNKNKTPEQIIADAEKRLTQRVDSMLQSTAQRTQQEQIQANLAEIEKFAEAKDAQGKPLHPFFDEVSKDMLRLIRAAKSEGERLSLQDAYDQATYANPKTRDKVLSAKDAERRAKEEKERKRKADAARRAGFRVEGEGAASSGARRNDHDSITADLTEAWDNTVGKRV